MSKVTIEREECISCGNCWTICPDVFEQSPTDDFSQLLELFRAGDNLGEGEIPDDLHRCAQDAADACPVSIIDAG